MILLERFLFQYFGVEDPAFVILTKINTRNSRKLGGPHPTHTLKEKNSHFKIKIFFFLTVGEKYLKV